MRLFQAASSPGGARPKVVVEDDGIGWLVKLPSSRDRYDMVCLEAASMGLAGAAGIEVGIRTRTAIILDRLAECAALAMLSGAVGLTTALRPVSHFRILTPGRWATGVAPLTFSCRSLC